MGSRGVIVDSTRRMNTICLASLLLIALPVWSSQADAYSRGVNAGISAAMKGDCAKCVPIAQIENEPACGEDYVDLFNGGCNSTPPVFSEIGDCWICGTTGGFLALGVPTRDADWYTFDAPRSGAVAGLATVPLRLSVQDRGCPSTIIATSTAPACGPTPVIAFEPGSYVLMVTVDGVGPEFPCGSEYVIAIRGLDVPCEGSPVEDATWGRIKALYGR